MPRTASLPIILFLLLAAAGCGTKSPYAPIRDITELAQDAATYHGLAPHTRLLAEDVQQTAYEHFIQAHFAPWDRTRPEHTAEEVFWGLATYDGKELFGENTLPRDPGWMVRMQKASRVEDYPSMGRRAITVTNTNMRVLPTHRPAFYSFKRAGEGFPFDYMQNSLVLAGTPLYATHTSADRAWILVESRFAFGWVPAGDIAWVDNAFVASFQTGTYGAVTRDGVSILDSDGQYCFSGHIGTLLPVLPKGETDDGFVFIIPTKDEYGNAVAHLARVNAKAAASAPVPATPANFAKLANTMLGLQYGWGGLYENRDCSATTMDLMAAFGILLPRNSSKQIEVGRVVSLEGMDRDEKKRIILEKGVPFLTLVRKSGHIMLYVGSRDGEPLVLHSTWGVKTEQDGAYGRKVIGSTVITTLEPGLELDNLARPEGILLETVYAITTLP